MLASVALELGHVRLVRVELAVQQAANQGILRFINSHQRNEQTFRDVKMHKVVFIYRFLLNRQNKYSSVPRVIPEHKTELHEMLLYVSY